MRATVFLPAIVALSLVGCATAPNAERTNANQLFASAGPYRDNDLADNKIPKHSAVASWTPFYVVKVKRSQVDGHSDIWRAEFRKFLAQFITISLRQAD